MSKILLICHDIPSMTVGATLPFYHLIKELGKKHDMTLVSFDSGNYPINPIKDYLKEVITLEIPEYLNISGQLQYTVKNMLSADNIHTRSFLNYYYHPDMNQLIRENIGEDTDIIITDMPMAFYVKNVNIKKIVYAFDAVSDYNYNMYKKSTSLISKSYWYLNYLKIHNYEKAYNSFDVCVLVNDKDKKLLEKDIDIPIKVIPNGVDTDYFKNNSEDESLRIVFLGDMSTPPNNDAVKYFVDNIYSDLLNEVEIPFYIVGRNPSEYVKSLASNKIHVTGSVDDVREYLTRGSIFITPMISGTGIKNKILEAMSMQLPVISTSTGISGISAENKVNFLLADNITDFKNHIITLSKNSEIRKVIGDNARLFVEEKYSWQKSMHEMEKLIEQIIP